MKYAVIATGGKQYLVKAGDTLRVEKLEKEGAIAFDQVLLTDDGATATLGTPTIAGLSIPATITAQGRARKVTVVHFKPKARERKKYGHRQPFTEVTIGDF